MIKITNLLYRYPEAKHLALENINLHIEPASWVAIIGANGSGKSTFAKHLNGLLWPFAGSVLVDGLDTADQEAIFGVRQKVAFVFQNPDNQIVGSTVEDDIAFGPENLALPAAEIGKRVERALDICQLQAVRNKEPYLLSGGEKQRLAIAGALAMEARYLVLDEATSMLDPLMRRQVLDTLSYLHQKLAMGIIMVTNVLAETLLAQRVIVLHEGRVVADGTPQAVFADPQSLEKWGLAVPPLYQLIDLLSGSGLQLTNITDEEALVEALCR